MSSGMMVGKKSPVILIVMALMILLIMAGIAVGLILAKTQLFSSGGSHYASAVSGSMQKDKEQEEYLELGTPHHIWDATKQTGFRLIFESAWYSDEEIYGEKDKRALHVVYSYQNLGPREGQLVFYSCIPFHKTIELILDNGHIYGPSKRPSLDVAMFAYGDWRRKSTDKIGEVGQEEFMFDIPKTSTPSLLSIKFSNGKFLRVKLPQSQLETKERFRVNPFDGSLRKG